MLQQIALACGPAQTNHRRRHPLHRSLQPHRSRSSGVELGHRLVQVHPYLAQLGTALHVLHQGEAKRSVRRRSGRRQRRLGGEAGRRQARALRRPGQGVVLLVGQAQQHASFPFGTVVRAVMSRQRLPEITQSTSNLARRPAPPLPPERQSNRTRDVPGDRGHSRSHRLTAVQAGPVVPGAGAIRLKPGEDTSSPPGKPSLPFERPTGRLRRATGARRPAGGAAGMGLRGRRAQGKTRP